MPESYRVMESRHAALDELEQQQEYAARWAGLGYQSCSDVAEVGPAAPHDCTTCRYAQGDAAPYWCIAVGRSVFHKGKVGCSGWPWDPKADAAA